MTTDNYVNSGAQTQYGWVCPKCGTANAPWKSTCDCATYTASLTSDNKITINPDEWWKPKIKGEADSYVGGNDYWDPITRTWTVPLNYVNLTNIGDLT